MFLLTNIETDKPLTVHHEGEQRVLCGCGKVSREQKTHAKYYAFTGIPVNPRNFTELKVLLFEKPTPEPAKDSQDIRMQSISSQEIPRKRRIITIKTQVLPVLNENASRPKDFYHLDCMFSEDVLYEARNYEGNVHNCMRCCENTVIRNLGSLLLFILGDMHCAIPKAVAATFSAANSFERDRLMVLILILMLMGNDWQVSLENIPFHTRKLREFLMVIGCRISRGVAILCKKPKHKIQKRQL